MRLLNNTMLKQCACILLLVSFTNCEEYLERTPESIISEETAFQNFENFQGYTEELYHCIPNFTLTSYAPSWNWGDDEILSTANTGVPSFYFDRGNFFGWQAQYVYAESWLDSFGAQTNNDNHTKGMWPLAWYGIRKANLGLENLDRLTNATQEERDLIEGQLLYFRGWLHFMLIQHFGGLPYIDRVLPSDEPLREPRLSYHECAEKVATDLRRAADLLPINWDNTVAGRRTLGKNTLRINKIMALGYLGKNLLWAGSPLMNLDSTGSREYNTDYCRRAGDAFGELLGLVESGQTQYALEPFENVSQTFYTRGQNWLLPGGTEAIFKSTYWQGNGSNYFASKQYFTQLLTSWASTFAPTANYVNYYGMANGMPLPDDITQADPESGYDPEHPFKNRDPRFYKDIVFDGVRIVQGSMPPGEDANRYANLFTGGSYRDIRTGSRSGYCNRKFVPLVSNRFDQGNSYGNALHLNVPYMRLGDVYLMYSEAVLMGYNSPTATSNSFGKTALDAINVIRERAGMPNVLPRFTASAATLLPELRRERAVELSFERHRFNDLRRWLLLIERPYTIKTSIEFDRAGEFNTTNPEENRIVNLREEVILEREYTERHYWLPLKVADVNLYPELNQNPGW